MEHPCPRWWDQLRPAPKVAIPTHICQYCGHTRDLHGEAGCTAKSSGLFDRCPCTCTNRGNGELYKDPSRMQVAR